MISAKDAFMFSFAAIGAVLGIINTLHLLNQNRVKLRVVPKFANFVFNGQIGRDVGCIEVINLSTFPITVSEIGFTLGSGTVRSGTRAQIPCPYTADRKPFARRLGSRESITGYFELDTLPHDVGKVYAKTDCDEIAYGDSPAFQNYHLTKGTRG